MRDPRSCLSHWFPRVRDAGLPVPKTEIVLAPNLDRWATLKPNQRIEDGLEDFFAKLYAAAEKVGGFPCFLRTGYGSAKHHWIDTCCVPERAALPQHAFMLYDWSNMVDMLGLPTEVWVVRELLKTEPVFHAFLRMPIVKERRYFVRDGEVTCHHPYWPEDAFDEDAQSLLGGPDKRNWRELVADMNVEPTSEVEHLTDMSRRVSEALPGFWSVDWLQTLHGWVLIDMAAAERSFHWPGCDARVKA